MNCIKNEALCVLISIILSLSCGDDESNKKSSPWEFLGRGISDGEISSLALDNDSSGNPIVAYRDDANGSRLTVQKYNGTAWTSLGTKGFTNGAVSYVYLDVYGNTPYVAFSDNDVSNRVSVMKYNGSSWEFLGVQGFSAHAVYEGSYNKSDQLSLSVLDDTEIYVAYIDITSRQGPWVYMFSGGNWSDITGGTPASTSETYEISIFAESSTSIYAAYISNNNLNLMRYHGSGWDVIGTAITGARDISLKGNNGIPYIAYSKINGEFDTGGDNNSEPDRAVVNRYVNMALEQVGDIISESTATEISLSFDTDDNPYVCYVDWDGPAAPTIHKYVNSEWSLIGKNIIDVGTHYVSMTVYDNKPIVAYRENDGEYQGKLTVMRYK